MEGLNPSGISYGSQLRLTAQFALALALLRLASAATASPLDPTSSWSYALRARLIPDAGKTVHWGCRHGLAPSRITAIAKSAPSDVPTALRLPGVLRPPFDGAFGCLLFVWMAWPQSPSADIANRSRHHDQMGVECTAHHRGPAGALVHSLCHRQLTMPTPRETRALTIITLFRGFQTFANLVH